MLDGMPMQLFREWVAYYQWEPWGEERADLRTASIISTYVNSHRRKGASAKPLSDFVLNFRGRKAKDFKSPEHQQYMKAVGAMIAGAHKR